MHPLFHRAHHHLRRAIDQPDTLGDADCEKLRDGIWGQPVNTVSSFAYVAAGMWLGARAVRLPRGERAAAGWYAAFVAVTGLGSVAYHGPQFTGAQLMHDVPIVGVVGIGAIVPFVRRRRDRPAVPGWSGAMGAAMAGAALVAGVSYVGGGTDSPVCRPESMWQFHGLWHVATASVAMMWGMALWPAGLALDGTVDGSARRSPEPAEVESIETGSTDG